MLFLVISDPRPEPPSAVTAQRQLFWRWIDPLISGGQVKSIHAKVAVVERILRQIDKSFGA